MSSAKDQVGRLLALVPLIRRRGEIHVDEAAALLGVSPAQLVTDLRVLIFCGWPGWLPGDLIEVDLDALEPGGDGMIRIANADYLAAPLRLSRAEASALLVALQTLRSSAGEDVLPSIDRAVAKIEEAVGARPVASVAVRPGPQAATRATLEGAVRDRRQVGLRYLVASRDEVTERVVDPLGIVTDGGVDYLDAWCHRADDRRSFRLDRMLAVTVLDTPAADHDLAPLDLSEGIFRPAADLPLVTLRLAPAARWVAEYYPVESRAEGSDGALDVTLRVADEAWLQRLLLRLTPHVSVLAPDAYAAAYRQTVAEVRALYT
ncbi:helix-turn-helix transcriptional regulator [Nocardioides jiangxiensis]|uniref:WYL domain-containing protein n=1 Tax=Nocardioides jiangxiensis TaxID=3064524 RepID=A0ABT9AZR2_9ACTN|nr:WYL domain-containing protein [Nocardioides sp. WY-20]MDO7866837.1 WYL domain-containing protein [Nocardioides sp. WY-20]